MERKIGEIFEYNGEWYQCLEEKTCTCFGCDFRNYNCDDISLKEVKGSCQSERRKDNKSVIFKKLEKVGEPFSCNYYGDARLVMMQEYQLFDSNVIYCYQTPPMYITDYKHKRIAIEIKINKEGMGENDIKPYDSFFSEGTVSNTEHLAKSNLKPFNLEKAQEGKPVCTRGGRKARIIYFDAKGDYPLVALIETENGERVGQYMIDGHCTDIISQCCDDLMMLPEKKDRWVNIYRNEKGEYWSEQILFSTKKDATDFVHNHAQYVTTVKIEWEE